MFKKCFPQKALQFTSVFLPQKSYVKEEIKYVLAVTYRYISSWCFRLPFHEFDETEFSKTYSCTFLAEEVETWVWREVEGVGTEVYYAKLFQ